MFLKMPKLKWLWYYDQWLIELGKLATSMNTKCLYLLKRNSECMWHERLHGYKMQITYFLIYSYILIIPTYVLSKKTYNNIIYIIFCKYVEWILLETLFLNIIYNIYISNILYLLLCWINTWWIYFFSTIVV